MKALQKKHQENMKKIEKYSKENDKKNKDIFIKFKL